MLRYVFDLDNTLCNWIINEAFPQGRAEDATPIPARIDKVNELYDQGHYIIIDTARGSMTGKDQFSLTEKQLKEWGVKYHELLVGKKPFRNYYVGDEAINDKDFFND